MKYIVLIVPNWNFTDGGVNSFNFDFALGLGSAVRNTTFQVICISRVEPTISLVKKAKEANVQVEYLNNNLDSIEGYQDILKLISGLKDCEMVYYVGHDVLTGSLANSLARFASNSSASIVFHHMDYESYYSIKGENKPEDTSQKFNEQRNVLSSADYVVAVGPKLKESALNKTGNREGNVFRIIPGIQDIEVQNTGKMLSAITFGRYDIRNDRLKQMALAAKAFAHFVETHREKLEDPALKVIGISDPEESKSLLSAAALDVRSGYINISTLPYTTDREGLFQYLKSSNVCLMLSVHEGFGLVGWEAIAAGVPLIVSQNTGLAKFLEEYLGADKLRDHGVYVVNVKGSMDGSVNDDDVHIVFEAFKKITFGFESFKKGVLMLRDKLRADYTWQQCGQSFIAILEEIDLEKASKDSRPQEHKYITKKKAVLTLIKQDDPQPLLDLDFNNEASELVFRSRSIHLLGRSIELDEIQQFATSQGQFEWWVLLGEGGSGKSRLALEAMIDLVENHDWYAGFFDIKKFHQFDWDCWSPAFNTLIVIDYTSRDVEGSVELLEKLRQVSKLFSKKVRVLLIERSNSGSWWIKVRAGIEAGKLLQMWRSEPLNLKPLTDNVMLDLIGSYKNFKYLGMTKTEILSRLKKNVKYNLPLYAISGLLNLGGKIGVEGDDSALERFIDREDEEIWKSIYPKEEERGRQKNLLAYIILAGGLTTEELKSLLIQNWNIFPRRAPVEIFAALNLLNKDASYIKSPEPDLLGEYFIYNNYFRKPDPFDTAPAINEIIGIAWSNKPDATKRFVIRFIADFPHIKADVLLPEPSSGAVEDVKKAWCEMQVERLGLLKLDDGNRVEIWANSIRSLKEFAEANNSFKLFYLRGLQSLIENTAKQGYTKVATFFSTILSEQLQSDPDPVLIRESCYLYFRLAKQAIFKEEDDAFKCYLTHLKELAGVEDTNLAVHLINKLMMELDSFNAITSALEQARRMDVSRPIVITQSNEDQNLEECKALSWLIWSAFNLEDWQMAQTYFNKLKTITTQIGKPEFIRAFQDGAKNILLGGIRNRSNIENVAGSFYSLSFSTPLPDLGLNWIMFWESVFDEVIRKNYHFSSILLKQMDEKFAEGNLTEVSANFYWSCQKRAMEYYLENDEIEKALAFYGRIERMFDLDENQQDAASATGVAIDVSLYYQARGDAEKEKEYYEAAKKFAKQGGLNFSIIYKLKVNLNDHTSTL